MPAHGKIRQNQVITTYGPGALIDLPRDAAIVGGLDDWPLHLEEILEPRLTRRIQDLTGVASPRLYAPPRAPEPWERDRGITGWRFPEWFVVQETSGQRETRHRRMVHRRALDDRYRFDRNPVVPTRFVRACPRGHVDDIDWVRFAHGGDHGCGQQLWLDEVGTTGDLGDLIVRCACGKSRRLYEASDLGQNPLGTCEGRRPWLGNNSNEHCNQPSRLLVRTASNSYFPQVINVLSLPDRATPVVEAVQELWGMLQIVDSLASLEVVKRLPNITDRLEPFSDADILSAIEEVKTGNPADRRIKQVELDALLNAEEGFGDDVPIDPDFHARRLPDTAWRKQGSQGIASVIQLHRLREVMALVGFTRLEAAVRDIHGEYETDVERAQIALEPSWFPAVENRGEGIFIGLDNDAVNVWLQRPGVAARLDELNQGHMAWYASRGKTYPFPGGPYILLHTLSHLLIQALAMRCGYPASSIRERIYSDDDDGQYGILLYTGTSDAEGTLGGLVQQGRHIEEHLINALVRAGLCSNDPICAQRSLGESVDNGSLHGAACHGCTLIAETSCEMRNDYLDRALVVPVLGVGDAAFFQAPA